MKRLLKNLFLVLALLISKSIFGSVIYVDSSKATAPLKNGLTWATAFSDLNSAMAAAKDGDELWFSKGTYTTSSPIRLTKSVTLIGGFIGGESNVSQSKPDVNQVLFSHSSSLFTLNSINKEIVFKGLGFRSWNIITMEVGSVPLLNSIQFLDCNFKGFSSQIFNIDDVEGDLNFEDCIFENVQSSVIYIKINRLNLKNVKFRDSGVQFNGSVVSLKVDSIDLENHSSSPFFNFYGVKALSCKVENVKLSNVNFSQFINGDFSDVFLSNIQIDNSNISQFISGDFSAVAVNNIQIDNSNLFQVIYSNLDSAFFDQIRIENCNLSQFFLGSGNVISLNNTEILNSEYFQFVSGDFSRIDLKNIEFNNNTKGAAVFTSEGNALRNVNVDNLLYRNIRNGNTIFQFSSSNVNLENINIINSKFLDSKFMNLIDIQVSQVSQNSKLVIDNCEFKNDTSNLGAISVSNINLEIQNSSFDNLKGNSGSLITSSSRDVFVQRSIFKDISVQSFLSFNGSGSVILSGCEVINVISEYSFINISRPSFFKIMDSKFENNSASYYQTSLVYLGGSSDYFNCEISNTNFRNNFSVGSYYGNNLFNIGSGVVDGSIKFNSCLFYKNKYKSGLLGLYQNTEIKDCKFYSDTLDVDGVGFIKSSAKKLLVENCEFNDVKISGSGGAIYASNSPFDLKIMNSSFKNCISANFGGAVFMSPNEKPVFLDGCSFTNCKSDLYGGAINCDKINANNCLFLQNSAATGSAIYSNRIGSIGNCSFLDNFNGNVLNIGSSGYEGEVGEVKNSRFENNRCSGSLLNIGVPVTNCTFKSNLIKGAILNYAGANISINNSLFDSNQIETSGEFLGAYAVGWTFADVNNSTFVNNKVVQPNAEVKLSNQIKNSIFWDNNFGPNIKTLNVTNSNIQGGYPGEGNTDLNPQFVDPANGDFRLSCSSPLINKGSNQYVTSTLDLDGKERVSAGTVDMGAYEFQGDPAIVNATPQPSFSLAPSGLCKGQTQFFVNQTTGLDNFTYFWDFGIENATSTEKQASHAFAKEGTYQISLTATNGCGRSETIKKSVEIKNTFVPTIQYPSTVCPGDTLEFTTNASTCGSLVWSVTNGSIFQGQGTSKVKVKFDASGNKGNADIRLLATNCGIQDVCEVEVNKIIPIVPTKPKIVGAHKFCENTESSYTIAKRAFVPGVKYVWLAVGGEIIGESQGYALDSVKVRWTTANLSAKLILRTYHEILKCEGKDTFDVEVRPQFKVVDYSSICGNSSIQYYADKAGSFNWSILEVGHSINATNGLATWSNKAGLFNVVAKSLDANAFCNLSDTSLIKIKVQPKIDNILGEKLVNTTSTYEYQVVSANDSITNYYINANGGQSFPNQELSSIKWNGAEPFSISATLTRDQCNSEPYVLNITKDVVFGISGINQLCVNTSASFNSTITNATGATYRWVFEGDTIAATSTSPSFAFKKAGISTLRMLVDYNGRKYIASKNITVDAFSANVEIIGENIIAPAGGGIYQYQITNPNSAVLSATVIGAKSHLLTGTNLQVEWGVNEPFEIKIAATKSGELCSAQDVVKKVNKAKDLKPKITLQSGKWCLNQSLTLGFNADDFTKNVKWSVVGNALLLSQDKNSAVLELGNTAGDLKISVAYERFGAVNFDTTINIGSLPSPQIIEALICGDKSATLTPNQNYSSYTWIKEPENKFLVNTKSAVVTEPGFYRLVVQDAKACEGSISKNIRKIDFKEAVIYDNGLKVCPGTGNESFVLKTFDNFNYSYKWYVDNVLKSTSVVLTSSIEKTALKTQVVRLDIQSEICTSTITKTIAVQSSCGGNNGGGNSGGGETCAIPAINYNVVSCQPHVFQTTTNQTSGVTWSFGDGTSSTALNPTKLFEDVGYFDVVATKGCRSWAAKVEVPVLTKIEAKIDNCSGDEVEFKDYSAQLPDAKILSYQWDFGDGNKINGTTQKDRSVKHKYLVSGKYLTSLSIVAENSTGSVCTYIDTQTVVVNALPIVAYNIVEPVCGDNQYEFKNTSTQATAGANYLWTIDALTRNGSGFKASFATVGAKSISLEVTDFIGCKNSLPKNFTVKAPVLPKSITQISGGNYLCKGNVFQLEAPLSQASYQWYLDGVLLSNTTRVISATKPGSYTVKYKDGVCDLFSTPITINGFFPSNALIVEKNPSCLDKSTTLEIKNLPSNVTVKWYKNSVLLSQSNALSLTNLQLSDEASYGAVLKEGGLAQCEFTLNDFNLTLKQNPDKPVLVLSEPGVCYDTPSFVTLSNFNALNTYSWKVNNQSVVFDKDTLFVPNSKITSAYELVAKNSFGCESISDPKTLKVVPNVTNVLSSSKPKVCQYTEANVNSNLSDQDYTFEWYKSTNAKLVFNTKTLSVLSAGLDLNGGLYSIAKSKATLGKEACEFKSAVYNLEVLEGPQKPLIGGASSFCDGQKLTLSTTLDKNFTWSTNKTSQTIDVYTGGNYSLTVVDPKTTCSATTLKTVVQNPKPNLSFIGTGNYTWCGNKELSFTGLSAVKTFQWKLEGAEYGNVKTQLTPRISGKYTVSAETYQGCKAESDTLRVTSEACGACIVTSVEDKLGVGSLRDAILCANNNAGIDFVVFKIPGTGVKTLKIDAALPKIKEGVIIDGFSQTANNVYDIQIKPGTYSGVLFELENNVDGFSMSGLEVSGFAKVLDGKIGSKNTFVVKNKFTQNDTTLRFDKFTNNLNVSSNSFNGGVGLVSKGGLNTVITGNKFDLMQRSVRLDNSSKLTVLNNEFVRNNIEALVLTHTQSARIENNYFGVLKGGGSLGNTSSALLFDANTVVTGNTFVDNQGSGIQVMGDGFKLDGQFVESSTITPYGSSYVFKNTFTNNSVAGIQTYGPKVNISENIFTSSTSSAYAIQHVNGGNNQKINVGINKHTYGSNSVTLEGFGVEGDTIEVFKSNGTKEQALKYIGYAVITGGKWSYKMFDGEFYSTSDISYFLMTMTDVNGNTTQLNNPYKVDPFLCGGKVTSVADNGNGTLRREIECANMDPDKNTILFDLSLISPIAREISLLSTIDVVYPIDIVGLLSDSIKVFTDKGYLRFLDLSDNSSVNGFAVDGKGTGTRSIQTLSSENFAIKNMIVRGSSEAFYSSSSEEFSIVDSRFENNTSRPILTDGISAKRIVIENTVFANNKGAIRLGSGSGYNTTAEYVRFNNCYVYGNQSQYIIEVASNNVSITNSHFGVDRLNNIRLNTGKLVFGVGTQGSLIHFKFENNKVLNSGVGLSVTSSVGESTIKNNSFGIVNSNTKYKGSIAIQTGGGFRIENNLFVGYDSSAIKIEQLTSGNSPVYVINNQFGFDSSKAVFANKYSIHIDRQNLDELSEFKHNVIGYSNGNAFLISRPLNSLKIDSNFVGVDKSGRNIGGVNGIKVSDYINVGLTLKHNKIANQSGEAISVVRPNTWVTENQIYNNGSGIVHKQPNGNIFHPKPFILSTISDLDELTVKGTGTIGDKIELFKGDGGENNALSYIATVTVDNSGQWFYPFENIKDSVWIIATATASQKNTSEFSKPYLVVPYLCGSVVTNVDDSGNGTLRRAVECANNYPDKNTISFDLSSISPAAREITLLSKIEVKYPISLISDIKDSIKIKTGEFNYLSFESESDSSAIEGLIIEGGVLNTSRAIQLKSSEGFSLKKSILRNLNEAIYFISTNSLEIDKTTFERNRTCFMYLGGAIVKGTITNSFFKYNSESVMLGNGSESAFPNTFTFENNYIYGNKSQKTIDVNCLNLLIANNIFGEDEMGNVKLNKGVNISAINRYPSNVRIDNNEFLSDTISINIMGSKNFINYNKFGFTSKDNFVRGVAGVVSEGNNFTENEFIGFDSAAIILTTLYRGDSDNNIIEGNYLGITKSGKIGANKNGIVILTFTNNLSVKRNVIGNSTANALLIKMYTNGTRIDSNWIGVTKTNQSIPNNNGISIYANYFSVKNNIIANSVFNAVTVSNINNHISQNQIYNNGTGIVHQQPNGNNFHPKPKINETESALNTLTIRGSSVKKDRVELFKGDGGENNALSYLATVIVDSDGNWSYPFNNIKDSLWIIATATDTTNNTSEFSKPYLLVPFLCNSIVTNVDDAGYGSLRRAMECATVLKKDITVDIAGTQNNVITLLSALPSILTLDQTIKILGKDKENNPLILVGDGSFSGLNVSNVELTGIQITKMDTSLILGSNAKATGLIIQSTNTGIYVNGSNTSLISNTISGVANKAIEVVNSTVIDVSLNQISSVDGNAVVFENSTKSTITSNVISSAVSTITLSDNSQQINISKNVLTTLNELKAIDLSDLIVNNSKDTCSPKSFDQNVGVLTLKGEGQTGDLIEVFASNGKVGTTTKFLGTTSVINGLWSFTIAEGVNYNPAKENYFVFTATDITGNTSELTKPFKTPEFTCSFVVTSALSKGNGTLNRAIQCANANPDLNEITFDFKALGATTFNLPLDLPLITNPLILNGAFDKDTVAFSSVASGNPLFTVNSANVSFQNLHFKSVTNAIKVDGNAFTLANSKFLNVQSALTLANSSNSKVENNTFEIVAQPLTFNAVTNSNVQNNKIIQSNHLIDLKNSNNNSVVSNVIYSPLDNQVTVWIDNSANSFENTFSKNLFLKVNEASQQPISINLTGNNSIEKPIVETTSLLGQFTKIDGVAKPNSLVELFLGEHQTKKNAFHYLGSVTTDNFGKWSYTLRIDSLVYLLATVTNNKNTSEYSDPYQLKELVAYCPVTNVDDTGEGSLREAINCVNDAGDKKGISAIVEFLLPTNKENQISVLNSGFTITNSFGVLIDPKLVKVKLLADKSVNAFTWQANKVELKNLSFEGFDSTIVFAGDANKIQNLKISEFKVAMQVNVGANNQLLTIEANKGELAFEIFNQDKLTFSNNKIANTSQVKQGLVATSLTASTFSNNLFGVFLTDLGASFDSLTNTTVRFNQFASTKTAVALSVKNSSFVYVENNPIKGGLKGIVFDNVHDSYLLQTKLEAIQKIGIELLNSDFVEINDVSTLNIAKDAKIIDLHLEKIEESNQGHPRPEFTNASYKSGFVTIYGKSTPNDEVAVYETSLDSIDLKTIVTKVKANSLGVFEFKIPARPEDINDKTFKAIATASKNGLGKLYSYSSEVSAPFNPNIKICFVTTESDDSIKGSMRYNIGLANQDKCNLMLFEVSGQTSVLLTPQTHYPEITAYNLTIDASSQAGWKDTPIVKLLKSSSVTNAYTINNDTGKIYINALEITDFDTSIVLKKTQVFHQSLSSHYNFKHSFAFLDTTVESISLDSNHLKSDRADYVIDATVPRITLRKNFLEGGKINNLIVHTDTLTSYGNLFKGIGRQTGYAVTTTNHAHVLFENDVVEAYDYGVYADSMRFFEIKNVTVKQPKLGIKVLNDSSSLIYGNNVLESDTAFYFHNLDQTVVRKNSGINKSQLGSSTNKTQRDTIYNEDLTIKEIIITSVDLEVAFKDKPYTSIGFIFDSIQTAQIDSNKVLANLLGYVLQNSPNQKLIANESIEHDSAGIWIDSLSVNTQLYSNRIGFVAFNDLELNSSFSEGYGIYLLSDSNKIGTSRDQANYVGKNIKGGIGVVGKHNLITHNTIAKNDTIFNKPVHFAIVHLDSVGNDLIPKPSIDQVYEVVGAPNLYKIHGHAQAFDTVHVYNSNGFYESAFGVVGTTIANDTGYWETVVDRSNSVYLSQYATFTVVATATDSTSNTSQLSNMIYLGSCYVTNALDDTSNTFPYPNSLRQGMYCVNEVPEFGNLLVAKSNNKPVLLERQLIDLKNHWGADLNGKNLLLGGDTISVFGSFLDEVSDTNTILVVRDTVGHSKIQNMKFSFADTALIIRNHVGTDLSKLKMQFIGESGVYIDTNVRDMAVDQLKVVLSSEAIGIQLAGRDTNITITNSSFNDVLYGLLASFSDSLTLKNSSFISVQHPIDIQNSVKTDVIKNKIELAVIQDKDAPKKPNHLVFKKDSLLLFDQNEIKDSAYSFVVEISELKSSDFTKNKVKGDQRIVFNVSNSDSLKFIQNEVEQVYESFVNFNNTSNSLVKSNKVEKIIKKGIVAQSSDHLVFSQNLFIERDSNIVKLGIIDINKNGTKASNNSKQEPTIVGYKIKKNKSCDEEKVGIYLYGQAQEGDLVELFFSANKYSTHTEYLDNGIADETGYWEVKVPSGKYTSDTSKYFTFSATGTDTASFTSQESALYEYSKLFLYLDVTNTDNGGNGSLREAFEGINCSDLYNIVNFKIDLDGPHVIEVQDSLLDSLDTSLGFYIDAKSQQYFVNSKEGKLTWNTSISIDHSEFEDSAAIRVEKQVQDATIAHLGFVNTTKGLQLRNSKGIYDSLIFKSKPNSLIDSTVAVKLESNYLSSFTDCIIDGYDFGFYLDKSNSNTIQSNTIKATKVGLTLFESQANQIKNDTFAVSQYNVYIEDCKQVNYILANQFERTAYAINHPAVVIHNSDNQVIGQHQVSAMKATAQDTILPLFAILGNSSNNYIIKNRIGIDKNGLVEQSSNMYGVYIESDQNGVNNQILENEFAGMNVPAIYAKNTNSINVTKNYIGIDSGGVQVAGKENYDDAAGVNASAIVLDHVVGANISNNQVVNYQAYAVDVLNSSEVMVQYNKLFSEKTVNKAINLHHEETTASNIGLDTAYVLDNDVIDETSISITGKAMPNAQVLVYESFKSGDSLALQSFRFIKSAQADAAGDWTAIIATANYGFTEFNQFVVQNKINNATSEYSRAYKAKSDLCKLTGKAVDFFPALYEPCPNSEFTVNVPLAGAQYLWTPNDAQFAPITTQSAKIPSSSTVTLLVTDESICTYTETFDVSYKPMPIYPNYIVTNKALLNDTIVVVDVSNQVLDSYNWTVSGASKIVSEDPAYVKFIVDAAGDYIVTQTSLRGGCQVAVPKTISIKEGGGVDSVVFISKNNSLNVYPNPAVASGKLNILVQTANDKEVTVYLRDLLGQGLLETKLSGKTSYTLEFDLNTLGIVDGVYIVSLVALPTVINYSIIIRN